MIQFGPAYVHKVLGYRMTCLCVSSSVRWRFRVSINFLHIAGQDQLLNE
ncbi:hypothetical protein BJ956_002006 [Arthrobacter psychrochitiniphilus]|nr:hypothetical protein [Arthrobacter psychrochitiniphilus]